MSCRCAVMTAPHPPRRTESGSLRRYIKQVSCERGPTGESDSKVVTKCHPATRHLSISSLLFTHTANKSISTVLERAAIFCCHHHFILPLIFPHLPLRLSPPPSPLSPAGPGCHICSTSIISTSCHPTWRFLPDMP